MIGISHTLKHAEKTDFQKMSVCQFCLPVRPSFYPAADSFPPAIRSRYFSIPVRIGSLTVV